MHRELQSILVQKETLPLNCESVFFFWFHTVNSVKFGCLNDVCVLKREEC